MPPALLRADASLTLAGAAALAGLARPPDDPPLRELAAAAGLRIGAAVDAAALRQDPEYARVLARHFDAVTPENALKWAPIEHQPGIRDTADADLIVAFAREHRQVVKGHALVWDQEIPHWIDPEAEPARLRAQLDAHLRATVGRFGPAVDQWDVVNEALDPRGELAPTPFIRHFGVAHLVGAFQLARALDPTALLLYNDYDVYGGPADGAGRKTEGMLRALADLKARGAPIDAVGLQAHLVASRPPDLAELRRTMARLHEMGLQVHLSEVDVQVRELAGARAGKELAQAELVYGLTRACLDSPGCRQITFWGVSDARSWVDRHLGADDPLLFDDQHRPKLAVEGLRAALQGRSPSYCGQNLVVDGDLERGARGVFTAAGQMRRGPEAAAAGQAGLRVEGRTAAWQGPAFSVLDALSEGVAWTAAAMARAPAGEPLQLTLRIVDGQGERFVPVAAGRGAGAGWTALSGELRVDLTDPVTRADLYVEGPAAGLPLDVDELRFAARCAPPR